MARILDNILCTIMIFFLTFAWTVYCLKDVRIALVLSAVVASCFCYVLFQVLSKRQTQKEAKRAKKKLLADFAMFLQFNCDNSELFTSLLNYYNFTTQTVDFDNIIATKNQRVFVSICFQGNEVTPEQVQRVVVLAKRNNCEKAMIFGNKANNSVVALANSQIPTQFVDVANCYRLFEHAENIPKIPRYNAPKQSLFCSVAFNKKRFGWYFASAVFTLVTAAFSFLKLYLLVWSTVLFALSAYSLFNKKYNKTPTAVTLD